MVASISHFLKKKRSTKMPITKKRVTSYLMLKKRWKITVN